MIYFLVNNNYHLDLDLKLAKQLSQHKLGLIQVPYSLDIVSENLVFSKIYTFSDKIVPSIRSFFIHPYRISNTQREVKLKVHPKENDILFVHTDMDLLNQYIIQLFYENKAKIYLLEDGTATMTIYNICPLKASIKERIKTLILKHIYNFKYTKISVYGSYIIPVMKDFIFNGVIVNFGNSILRDIPLFKLSLKEEVIKDLDKNSAIFFNQPLYYWYLNELQYIDFLSDLLEISNNFVSFYFKFHPSDSNSFRAEISKLIQEKYCNITIITENDISENIIHKYPVAYAITINSTSSLNLINKGLIPVFLINLFNEAFPNENFMAFENFLKSINCYYPKELSEIRPGFCAFLEPENEENREAIAKILNLEND
jgi:hypothetical protein